MLKILLMTATVFSLTACGQANSNNQNDKLADATTTLAKDQKMDTAFFWQIMDNAFQKGKFDNKIKEQAILEQLIKLKPEQIQEFEIIFQQMNLKASTWGNYAAQTVIEGGSSDDRFYCKRILIRP